MLRKILIHPENFLSVYLFSSSPQTLNERYPSISNDKTMMDVCNGPVWNQNLRFHPENIEEENWKRTLLGIVCVSDVCIESQVFQITIICGLLLLKIFIFRGTRFENWALFHYGVRKHNNKSISHLGIIPDFQKRTEVVRDIFAII